MKFKSKSFVVIFLCASALSMADEGAANEGAADELRQCGLIDDGSLRLACYDRLSGRPASAPTSGAVLDTPPPSSGGRDTQFEVKDEDQPVVARVSRCVKDVRKKFVFYLENGQVWKQVSDKRLDFKECDFNVTISKDFFGYKMQQEGEKRRFRVSRVR